MILVNWIC